VPPASRPSKAALRALPGVITANVNLANERAYVTYNPSVTTVADMKKAIEDDGYQYLGIAGETSDAEEKAGPRCGPPRQVHALLLSGLQVSIPLMVLMWVPLGIPMQTLAYGMLIVSTPVFAWVAYPIFKAALTALKNKTLSMDVMYAMGTGVAYVASVMGTFSICAHQRLHVLRYRDHARGVSDARKVSRSPCERTDLGLRSKNLPASRQRPRP